MIKWIKPNFTKEYDEYFDNDPSRRHFAKMGFGFESEGDLLKFLKNGEMKSMTRESLNDATNITTSEDDFENELEDKDYRKSFDKMQKKIDDGDVEFHAPILIKFKEGYYGFAGNRRSNVAWRNDIPVTFWVVDADKKSIVSRIADKIVTDRIAKRIEGFAKAGIQKLGDGSAVFFEKRKRSSLFLINKGGDNWDAYFLHGTKGKIKRLIEKELRKDGIRFIERLYNSKLLQGVTTFTKKYIVNIFSNMGDEDQVVKILTESLNMFIETSAYRSLNEVKPLLDGDYSDLVVKKKSSISSRLKLFDFLVAENKLSTSMFIRIFGEYDIESEGSDRLSVFKYKKWKIQYDSKIKSGKEYVIDLLDEVESRLKSSGFNHLAYGRVEATDKISGAAASYNVGSDDLIIAVKKPSNRHVYNLIHELGHRHYYQKLSGNARAEVKSKYRFAKRGTPEINIEEGIKVIHKNSGEIYEFLTKIYRSGLLSYVLTLLETDSPRRQKRIGQKASLEYREFATGYERVDGKPLDESDFSSFFVTSYSMKEAEEMYAELFVHYVLKGLKEPVRSWFKNLR